MYGFYVPHPGESHSSLRTPSATAAANKAGNPAQGYATAPAALLNNLNRYAIPGSYAPTHRRCRLARPWLS
jgi:hypothetical protein